MAGRRWRFSFATHRERRSRAPRRPPRAQTNPSPSFFPLSPVPAAPCSILGYAAAREHHQHGSQTLLVHISYYYYYYFLYVPRRALLQPGRPSQKKEKKNLEPPSKRDEVFHREKETFPVQTRHAARARKKLTNWKNNLLQTTTVLCRKPRRSPRHAVGPTCDPPPSRTHKAARGGTTR